jgi:hypothetical protein
MNAMTMPKDIIANWEPRHETLFGTHVVTLKHRLADSGLFTREALGKLIERCPTSELGLVSRSTDKDNPERLNGTLGDASGLEAIAAIEKGKMWMNIRRVMDWAPEYRDLLNKVFDEFERRVPSLETNKHNLGVLISSPNAKVYYHADIQGQSLWQIEGSKTVYVYPTTEVFAPELSIEKILLRETDEDMAYQPWYDDFATAVELNPGDMVTWPLYAPHRVANHDVLNISVTMEHWTKPIWNAYAVRYGNGVLRRTLKLNRLSTRDRGLGVYPKAVAAFAWKKLGRQIKGDVNPVKSFRIDATAPEGRVAI